EGRPDEDDAGRRKEQRRGLRPERDTEHRPPDAEERDHLQDTDEEADRELAYHERRDRCLRRTNAIERPELALVDQRHRDAEQQKRDAEARHVLVEAVQTAGRPAHTRLHYVEEPRKPDLREWWQHGRSKRRRSWHWRQRDIQGELGKRQLRRLAEDAGGDGIV